MRLLVTVVAIFMFTSGAGSVGSCKLASVLDFPGKPTFENIRICLKNGGDVNERGRRGQTMLGLAVTRSDDAEIVRLLIANGADTNGISEGGRSVLHIAARFANSPEMINILIEAGADLEARDNEGYSPLHLQIARHSIDPADLQGMIDRIEVLVLAGADVNSRNFKGRTPLLSLVSYAGVSQNDYAWLVKILADAGADVDAYYYPERRLLNTLMVYILDGPGFEEEIAALIAAGANVNLVHEPTGQTPLHLAGCNNPSSANFEALVAAGASPFALDDLGRTPMDCARDNPYLTASESFRALLDELLSKE